MKNKLPNIVSLAILTAVVSVFWIFLNIYRIISSKPTPKISMEILEPLNPILESSAIAKLNQTLFFEEGEIPQTNLPNPQNIPVSIPEQETIQEATAEAIPSTASGEANQ
jgi:hypothetical protein